MERALVAVRKGEVGLNKASRTYGIPKATLKRRLDGGNKHAKGSKKLSGHPTYSPAELEQLLVKHCLDFESMLIGLTRLDLMSLAYQLAEANHLPHGFNKTKESAGERWYYRFIKRHPELSLRQAEATSMARARGFNRKNVSDFFDKTETIIDKHKLEAVHIFNMDESGITTVQKPGKVIARCGKKQVGALTSGERCFTTTVVCCFVASGIYVPPMIIFKRQQLPNELKLGAPPGSDITDNESGWMTAELFLKWLKHFHHSVKCTKENPILLILDGHATHTKNLDAILFAREHGIIMVSLPPHTTHRLQPLDRTFFKTLMLYYNQACDTWIRTKKQTVTVFQLAELFGQTYARSATIATAQNGFQCSLQGSGLATEIYSLMMNSRLQMDYMLKVMMICHQIHHKFQFCLTWKLLHPQCHL